MKAKAQEVIRVGHRTLTVYKQQGRFQSYDFGSSSEVFVCGFFDPQRESLDDLIKRFGPVTASK